MFSNNNNGGIVSRDGEIDLGELYVCNCCLASKFLCHIFLQKDAQAKQVGVCAAR